MDATLSRAQPFKIEVPQTEIDRIMARLEDIRWPDQPSTEDPWQFGASLDVMKDLAAYWKDQYNWREREERMNKFPHFKARIDDHDIHFIHVKGSGPNPQPIIISHGWPSTFTEFLKVIEPLAHPERFGGRVEDAFSVVVPSLPGFAFSSKPARPRDAWIFKVADLWDKLMHDVLGYKDYIAQGGDIGHAIAREQGYSGQYCKAVHLNLLVGLDGPPQSKEEEAQVQIWDNFQRDQGAYFVVNETTPVTIAYAMNDSPIGTAAWLTEKFQWWSDLKDGDLWSVYTRDEILDDIMLYLITRTFGTAGYYYAAMRDSPPPIPLNRGKLEKPAGFAHFPRDIAFWPRSYADRHFSNIIRWTEMSAGGHFAAAEQPELFVEELRAFARQLRS